MFGSGASAVAASSAATAVCAVMGAALAALTASSAAAVACWLWTSAWAVPIKTAALVAASDVAVVADSAPACAEVADVSAAVTAAVVSCVVSGGSIDGAAA